ncbi:hypothetical protein SAMN05216474_0644 [Lishizhenia tianjinensis]|uniref:Uncharacterized protein n=1 Tax=Lishizhenia tianjinensis TaxID=477690 RepID=A0A1I6Y417_9FLAO|nr:hypothetical protein [Lishizhenia tianjinensis]SFT45216.1 hypothetical protein SAMN05216474_0644 [Lishizhenia tianjinensis]
MKFLRYLILPLLLFSCKKEATTIDFGYDYFGLQEGRFVVYDGMYIFHDKNLVPAHDTTFYKLKTLVGKDYIDNSGRTAREFTRFLWNDATQEWEFKDLYTAIIDGGKAELVEENQRRIKLVFAVTEDKTWDENAYNTQEEINCRYASIGASRTINGIALDTTVAVIKNEYFTFYDHERSYEVYAKGVGMVKKYYQDLRILGEDSTVIETGIEEFLTLTDFGIE